MRLFESVSYTLEPAGENLYRLIFRVREDLLNTIGAGIRYDNDHGFTILLEFIARQLLGTPSRAAVSSQFGGLDYHTVSLRYVPFQSALFYLEPKIEISRQKRRHWGDSSRTYSFIDKREAGEIVLGGTLSRQVEFAAGYRIEYVRVSDAFDFNEWHGAEKVSGLTARLNWDSLDFPEYPRSGRQFSARFDKRDTNFGSDSSNMKGTIEYRRYIPTSDKGTLRMDFLAGYSEGGISFYDMFFVGGYSRSSRAGEPFHGFGADEITARQMAIARFDYSHRVLTRPLSILKQGYVTATYNSGVFSERGSSPYDFQNLNGFGAGLALDTRAGPFRMNLGWGEGGRVNFYLSFGPSF
jgi:outer membrane protein assembly factor BamA